MFERQLIQIKLPSTASIQWCHLYENSEDHIADEDIAYIILNNGIAIDASQYGEPPFFRVEAIAQGDSWDVIEEIEYKTTQEVAENIEKLSFKYSSPTKRENNENSTISNS